MKFRNKFLLFLLVFLAAGSTVYANNHISNINISVTVQQNGDANIIQEWQGTFEEGTENYIPINTQTIGITDVSVSDRYGEYAYLPNWDIDADFFDKARRFGVLETNDGVELCFGISEYGEKQYKISYTVTDFIKAYTDFDGVNFMFVNPGMNTFPTDAQVFIRLQNGSGLTPENAGIWGFGYEGSVVFQDGQVVATTTQPLDGNNSLILLLRLEKGLVTPKTVEDYSFNEVEETAIEGSNYESDTISPLMVFGILLLLLGVVALIVFVLVQHIRRKRAIRAFYQNAPYFREAPCDNSLEESYALVRNFDVGGEESAIIGATLLRMMNDQNILPATETDVGFFGRTRESVSLQLKSEPQEPLAQKLYRLLVSAAGEDGVLQEKELGDYTYHHPEFLKSFMETAKNNGEEQFARAGGYVSGAGNWISHLTDYGRGRLEQVMGLKKYLEDFSLIAERGIDEAELWQEYLVYATLFGIAEKVSKQLKEIYPERVAELEVYDRNIILCHSYYHTMYHSYEKSVQEQRSAGMGGSSSLGGGGGFSGGGMGGGSR